MSASQVLLSPSFEIKDIFLAEKTYLTHAPKIYRRGVPIYLQHEEANKIFYLAKGKIKVSTYSSAGKEMTKRFVSEGEIFGELTLLGNEKHGDFAFAFEESVVYSITIKELHHKMQQSPSLSLFIINKIGQILIKTEKRIEALVFQSSRDRIISFLKGLANEKGTRVGYEILVKDWLTHQEIANLTATSRQTVTTILNELRADNLIYFTRSKLLIRDFEKLA
jgi:CRP/FNR family transcriptional regulator, cyclic AMP receptor protein